VPAPLVCVVIPAFNEKARLPPFLDALSDAAGQFKACRVELIVSDDGSEPASVEAEKAAVQCAQTRQGRSGHRFRFIGADRNQGKGAAIRAGWAAADPSSEWLGFLDADGSISASEFFRVCAMLPSATEDALAASRIKMAGKQISRGLHRHLQGRVFATLVELTLRLGFYDTQCGLKFFRASCLRPLLPLLKEDHWLLDVELLAHLQQRGISSVEIPIDWRDTADSRVRIGIDAVRMLIALQRVRQNVRASL